MAYTLEGKLVEICNCRVLCPCWVGEDPDNETCEGVLGYHFDSGSINGVDVSGLNLIAMLHIPGNILKGNFRAMIYLDDRATEEQADAILAVFGGKQGGPVADLAQLIGEVVGVERVPIAFDLDGGRGTLRTGEAISAAITPFQGATGKTTALHEAMFSSIPDSPTYVAKTSTYRVNVPQLDLSFEIENSNAMQGPFRYAG